MRRAALALLLLAVATGAAGAADMKITFDAAAAAAGQVPQGWRVGNTNGGPQPAKWAPQEAGGRKVFSLVEPEKQLPGDLYNVAWMPDTKVRDIDISVQVKANTGRQDQGGGLIWRARDSSNYYIARYNPLETNFRIYYVKDGVRRQLATVEGQRIRTGEWFTMRIVHRGDAIEGYLNNQKVLEARDTTFRDAGAVGLWTKADAATSFDDLLVKEL